jgi:hypothetical protein
MLVHYSPDSHGAQSTIRNMALHGPQHLALQRGISRTFFNPISAHVRKALISTTRIRHFPKTTLLDMPDAAPTNPNPRWLSELKKRVGYCMNFGLSPLQVEEAGSILNEVANDWRELIAGSEGFLTGVERRGLFKQEVTWGEMVSADI